MRFAAAGEQAGVAYRADIDGLRALAVVAVVAFHAFPDLVGGGFIGVDIFFVISGYLISSITLREIQAGHFRIIDFYMRRIRRIFPALVLVLAATFAFGWLTLLSSEFRQLGLHVLGGAGFVANIVFWRESGYFDSSAETKPLLHLWSLGVEEQFYIVWPLVLWLACRRRWPVLGVVGALICVSFALNVRARSMDPVADFFSPPTRFWELLAGVALACAERRGMLSRLRLASAWSWGGLALIVLGLAVIGKDSRFPGFWALLPVGGATLVVAAGQHAWPNRHLLSHGLVVWLGLISYPLYLWHWPILSYLRILYGEMLSPITAAGAAAAAFPLAWLTTVLVERPLRFGFRRRQALALLLICMGAIAVLPLTVRRPYLELAGQLHDIEKFEPSQQASEACKAAFARHFRPQFIDHRDFCNSGGGAPTSEQAFSYVVGDSHANRLFLGLREQDKAHGYVNLGRGSCLPFFGVEGTNKDGTPLTCAETMDSLLKLAIQSPAHRIYVTAFFSRYFQGQVSTDLERLPEAVDRTFAALAASGKDVVLVLDVPILPFHPRQCLQRPLVSDSFDCSFELGKHFVNRESYRAVLTEAAARHDLKVIDPTDLFCTDGRCKASIGSKLLYADRHHLSSAGASLLAQFISERSGR